MPEWHPVAIPEAALELTLSHIEPDGTVTMYEDDGTPYVLPPFEPVNLQNLGELALLFEALHVASAVWRTFRGRADTFFDEFPETRCDDLIRNLAHYLASYRHNPVFLRIAVSLIVHETHARGWESLRQLWLARQTRWSS